MSIFRFFIVAVVIVICAPLSAQQLDNPTLNYSAAQDTLGDSVWTNIVNGTNNLSFAVVPTRVAIASKDFPMIVAGYRDGATGLPGFFDQSTPQRSLIDATFELWINVTTLAGGNDQVIFEAGGAARGISFILSGNQLRFNVKGDAANVSTITRTLTVGVHHIVGVIRCQKDNVANDAIELYHNGTLVRRLDNLLIEDWAGANESGLGTAASSVVGVAAAKDFSGDIASLRYYQGRAFTGTQVADARDYFRDRITVWVTGRGSYTNDSTLKSATTKAEPAGFRPTKVQLVGGTYWGLNFVESDGNDGLAAGQFKRLDVYTSPNGSDWTFVRTGVSRTDNPELLNARFESRQFTQTANGQWAVYAKHQYPTSARKNLICLWARTIDGPYRFSSGDLGIVRDGGSVYIISAATTEGAINILKTTPDGDALAELTKTLSWKQPDGSVEHREAPSLFYRGGYYFLTTSGQTGWRPNQQKYTYATSLGGKWSELVDLGDETGFHSQLFFTSGTNGSEESNKIFSATRNAPQWGGAGGSRPVRLPIYFNTPTEMAVNYYDAMIQNNTTGTLQGVHYDHGRQLEVTKAFIPGLNDNLSALIDGNEATTWANGNDAAKKEIRWDLGSAKRVKALKLMPVNPLKWAFVADIYVGDGTNWTKVFPTPDAPPVIPMMAFPAPLDVTDATGRYVRMVLVQNHNAGETTPGIINTFGFHETEIWGEDASPGLEVNETFDAQTSNTVPVGWVVNAGTVGNFKIVSIPSATNKSIQLLDNGNAQQVQASYSFTKQKGSKVTFEAKFRMDNAGSGEYIRLLQGTMIAFELYNAAGGLAFTNSAGNLINVGTVTTGVWHQLRVDINTDADTFDLFLDDKMVWGAGELRNLVNGLDKIVIGSPTTASRVSSYFDDITIDGPMPK
jgi:Concanavalin A-like lectin/glucanases superfamily/Glycosyl hydrolases family 43/F5/8 type C domain